MKTKEFENFFFYLTDKCRVLKGKEIAPEQKKHLGNRLCTCGLPRRDSSRELLDRQ